MSRRFRLPFAVALFVAVAAPVFAQTTIKREPVRPINDISGAGTFNAYCTVCHGPSGKGDGPAAKALVKPPADLTQISARNSGKFPANAVKMHISGETVVAAHGSRDMPMWGPVLKSTDGNAVELRLKNLVDYIESIQAK
jgi:mono/diheme cytochrome c family protein